MKAYKKIPLIFVLLLTVFTNLSAAVSAEERAALVALYDSTDGDNWTNNSNWNIGVDPCCSGWYGVTCTTEGVATLTLNNNKLTGTIPTQIGNLTSLERLYLYGNELTGSIPTEIGKLTSLLLLRLENNYLRGEIPSSINQTALYDNGGLYLETNCNLYSNDVDVQDFIVSKMTYATYEEFLETQGHCITLAPIIMYLLD